MPLIEQNLSVSSVLSAQVGVSFFSERVVVLLWPSLALGREEPAALIPGDEDWEGLLSPHFPQCSRLQDSALKAGLGDIPDLRPSPLPP